MQAFFTLYLTKFFRRNIVSFFVNNFDPFDVVTNGATITFDIFFTKFGLFHFFFWSQTFRFFLSGKLIDTSNFFWCHVKSFLVIPRKLRTNSPYFVFNWLKAATLLAFATRLARIAKRLFFKASSSAITMVLSKKASMTGLRAKS